MRLSTACENLQHRSTQLRIEDVAGRQVNRAIETYCVRDPESFTQVIRCKCNKVTDLLAFDVGHAKDLARDDFRCDVPARFNHGRCQEPSLCHASCSYALRITAKSAINGSTLTSLRVTQPGVI